MVAPLAGARIEITSTVAKSTTSASLPSRERGLKLICNDSRYGLGPVAPLAGARIEILYMHCMCRGDPSLPSRERGLKSPHLHLRYRRTRRSPRGSVD